MRVASVAADQSESRIGTVRGSVPVVTRLPKKPVEALLNDRYRPSIEGLDDTELNCSNSLELERLRARLSLKTGKPVFETYFFPSGPLPMTRDQLGKLIPAARIQRNTDNLAWYPNDAAPSPDSLDLTSEGWIVRADRGPTHYSWGWALAFRCSFLDRQEYWEDYHSGNEETVGAEWLTARVCLLLHFLQRCADFLRFSDLAPFIVGVRLTGTEGRCLLAKRGADVGRTRAATRQEVNVERDVSLGALRRGYRSLAAEMVVEVAARMEFLNASYHVARWLEVAANEFGAATLFPKDFGEHEDVTDCRRQRGANMTEKNRRNRLLFLKALYEATGGNRHNYVSMWELGSQLGFDRETTDRICQYLEGEYLLEYKAIGGLIGITHHGVREFEDALSKPAEPTYYFPPSGVLAGDHYNIVNINAPVYGSPIQQAGPSSTQEAHITDDQRRALKAFIEEVTRKIDSLGLVDSNKFDLRAELGTIDAQLKASKPRQSLIQSCLMTIGRILEGAAASATGQVLLEQLRPLLGG